MVGGGVLLESRVVVGGGGTSSEICMYVHIYVLYVRTYVCMYIVCK